MHPYFLDRLAEEQWNTLHRIAEVNAAARRRPKRRLRGRSGRRDRGTRGAVGFDAA